MRVNDLVMMDAASLASTIHMRRASCVEVMSAYLDHIEKLNSKVNAIVAIQDRGELLRQARDRDALAFAYESAIDPARHRPPDLLAQT
jgi:Asp-tRNA(Asn)/Glu-tRNA(Gln) amidotransferase A subunit family amidase